MKKRVMVLAVAIMMIGNIAVGVSAADKQRDRIKLQDGSCGQCICMLYSTDVNQLNCDGTHIRKHDRLKDGSCLILD